MILALYQSGGKKIGYRCFTNKLNTRMEHIKNALSGQKNIELDVYKALYGDIDIGIVASPKFKDVTLYSDLPSFREAIEC